MRQKTKLKSTEDRFTSTFVPEEAAVEVNETASVVDEAEVVTVDAVEVAAVEAVDTAEEVVMAAREVTGAAAMAGSRVGVDMAVAREAMAAVAAAIKSISIMISG